MIRSLSASRVLIRISKSGRLVEIKLMTESHSLDRDFNDRFDLQKSIYETKVAVFVARMNFDYVPLRNSALVLHTL